MYSIQSNSWRKIGETKDRGYSNGNQIVKGVMTSTISQNGLRFQRCLACSTKRLVLVFVAINAAPIGPRVLGASELMVTPRSTISCRNSFAWDSMAIVLDLPATTSVRIFC